MHASRPWLWRRSQSTNSSMTVLRHILLAKKRASSGCHQQAAGEALPRCERGSMLRWYAAAAPSMAGTIPGPVPGQRSSLCS